MKEKRADVIKECTLKESAAINQILGKMVRKGREGYWDGWKDRKEIESVLGITRHDYGGFSFSGMH